MPRPKYSYGLQMTNYLNMLTIEEYLGRGRVMLESNKYEI